MSGKQIPTQKKLCCCGVFFENCYPTVNASRTDKNGWLWLYHDDYLEQFCFVKIFTSQLLSAQYSSAYISHSSYICKDSLSA